MSRILFWDSETTGLSKDYNEFINLAAIVYNTETKEVEAEYDRYCKPAKGLPYQITQLTGITPAMVNGCPPESIVLTDFMQWVERQHCDITCGYNTNAFDNKWAEAKCKKYTIKNTLPETKEDTLLLVKEAYKLGLLPEYAYFTEKGNLSFRQCHLMSYFNLSEHQDHTALSDVVYCIEIYVRIKDLLDNQDFGF